MLASKAGSACLGANIHGLSSGGYFCLKHILEYIKR